MFTKFAPLFVLLLTAGWLVDPTRSADESDSAQPQDENQAENTTPSSSTTTETTNKKTLTFGLLNGGSSFFEEVKRGFEHKCQVLGVNCLIRVSKGNPCEIPRLEILNEFMQLQVDGIAMKPCSSDAIKPAIDKVVAAGIPVVTFDGDTPDSDRSAYIGTDNVFLGRTMAKLLRQLRPEGGTFAMLGFKQGRVDGFVEEITKYNDREDRAHWYEVDRDFELTEELQKHKHMQAMEKYAPLNPTALVAMVQSPMRHENWTKFVDANRHRNITYIGTDGADYQLEYLDRRYVDGLVGQLPFEMGTVSLEVLHELVTKGRVEKTFYPTNIVAYNLIPLELPTLDVEDNLLGNLKYVGFTFFGIVALSAVGCMAWTIWNRQRSVVLAAQPFFLTMVAAGTLILSSSLIPLSFDDGGSPETYSHRRGVGMCMSVPWLAFTGFTMLWAALFSKTLRVNKLFHQKIRFARVQVTKYDVLAPFACLLLSNIVVLTCWTVLDPLTYSRIEKEGTDYWNRVISTYGTCQSENVVAYLVPLGLINLGVVLVATWQAVQARDIDSEFSEARYIGLAVASLFQAFVTGVPVVVVVRETPKAYYLVLSIMIFILCVAILLLIFLPKISLQNKYSGMTVSEQRRMMASRVRGSSVEHSSSRLLQRAGSSSLHTSQRGGAGQTNSADSSSHHFLQHARSSSLRFSQRGGERGGGGADVTSDGGDSSRQLQRDDGSSSALHADMTSGEMTTTEANNMNVVAEEPQQEQREVQAMTSDGK